MIGAPGQEQIYSLATADRTYRLLVAAMNEGAATVSPRGVIFDANPRLASMAGRAIPELVGTSVLDLATAAHRRAFARMLDLGAGDSSRGEMELTGPDGTVVPVLLAASGFDLDGMVVRCLVLSDLTAQRAAEARMAQAHEELGEQSAFLEQARGSLGLGWWIVDAPPDGRVTASPEARQIFGLANGEFVRGGRLRSGVPPAA